MNLTRQVQDSTPRSASLFLVAFVALVGATALAHDTVPVLAERENEIAMAERPPDDDHYLASDAVSYVDHHVHYFGIDARVQERLRSAEVLFLGNSRLMFALRPRVLRPFFDGRRTTYYVMGFGFREGDRFPLAIIRKFDLRPRLVVVNADGFFGNGLSTWAEVVIRDSPFAARKLQWEAEIGHEVRRVTETGIPNLLLLFGRPGLALRKGMITYRSRLDGTWAISPWPEGTRGFRPMGPNGPPLSRGETAAAREFKAELEQRGSRLVLVRVPAPTPQPGAGPARFASLLDVPLVTVVEPPALTTHDDSHLSAGSAHDWSRALVDALGPVLDAPQGPGRRR